MNRPEPIFRGGPGQRAVQEKEAKLRAAAASSASVGGASRSSSHREKASAARGPGGKSPAVKGGRGAAQKARVSSARAVSEEDAACPTDGRLRGRVRLTVLKNIVGVFLLPVAWVWTVSFVGAFSRAAVHQRYWMTEDFWFFMLGVVVWLLAFSGGLYLRGEPPLLKMYVRIHEYTHAIWTWQSNGAVGEITVNDDHGHILTNKPTVLVTLAPYFYPLPCVVLIGAFLLVQLVHPLEQVAPFALLGGSISAVAIFDLLMGMGWGFHFSYTAWMIRKGQSDLRMHGNFFSLVVIYLVNLAVVTLFLILTAAGVDWIVFGRALQGNAEDFSEVVWALLVKVWEAAKDGAMPLVK